MEGYYSGSSRIYVWNENRFIGSFLKVQFGFLAWSPPSWVGTILFTPTCREETLLNSNFDRFMQEYAGHQWLKQHYYSVSLRSKGLFDVPFPTYGPASKDMYHWRKSAPKSMSDHLLGYIIHFIFIHKIYGAGYYLISLKSWQNILFQPYYMAPLPRHKTLNRDILPPLSLFDRLLPLCSWKWLSSPSNGHQVSYCLHLPVCWR